jgi:lipoprotein NlpI
MFSILTRWHRSGMTHVTAVSCMIFAIAYSPIFAEDVDVADLLRRASRLSQTGESGKAVELLSKAIVSDPKVADAYYLRGREYFRLGEFQKSVADFDKLVELKPAIAPQQWERGIALYYAGRFADGAKQFELYQTYHDNDVENSVWKYLCEARTVGAEKAREAILPIKNDRRVPMMQVYEMYRGRLSPAEVLAAAKADSPEPEALAGRLFYAHLYIGLFYEAAGNADLAKKYILQAADNHRTTRSINRYMWDVARVHADRLREPSASER